MHTTRFCLIGAQEKELLKSLKIRATALSNSQSFGCSRANGSSTIFRDLVKSTTTHIPNCVLSILRFGSAKVDMKTKTLVARFSCFKPNPPMRGCFV